MIRVTARRCAWLAGVGMACPLGLAGEPSIDFFGLDAPGGAYAIQQGSDLHFGRLGQREGLWLVCDRNGRESAGKLYFLSAQRLARAESKRTLVADDEFTVIGPPGEWSEFAQRHKGAGGEVLDELRKRVTPGTDRTDEPHLDLEAVTIAPAIAGPGDHVFVVAEEPHSTVLELALEGGGKTGRACLVGVYSYREPPEEQGTARNDGLEGLTYAGRPGQFYFAEEGTKAVDDQPRSTLMFSLEPRLGLAELATGRVEPLAGESQLLTAAIRGCRKGRMQTLNALTRTVTGELLAVDRNGGWIDRIEPATGQARAWLSVYDLDGVNLRELLAEFPGRRTMPYVSIEGIAVDREGAIWLLDDPAIPEGWRQSCLVRITRPSAASSAPSGSAPPPGPPKTAPR